VQPAVLFQEEDELKKEEIAKNVVLKRRLVAGIFVDQGKPGSWTLFGATIIDDDDSILTWNTHTQKDCKFHT
jgi:hypothetical protein